MKAVARLRNELVVIAGLTLLLVAVILLFPSNALRGVLAVPFMLFFPGYTLVATLFPVKSRLNNVERMALSFGVSLAVIPLIGAIMSFTPWGVRLASVLSAISVFTLAMAVIALWRRKRLPEEEQAGFRF